MLRHHLALTLTTTALLLGVPVIAQAAPGTTSTSPSPESSSTDTKSKGSHMFEKADANKDGALTKEEMLKWMEDHELNRDFGEVIVMCGAGDIDALVQPVKQIIERK